MLTTESKEEMENLLRIADTFEKELNIKYSTRKCKAMEFGEQEEKQWVLGNNILEMIDSYTYLGLKINKEAIGREKHRKMNYGKTSRISGMVEWRNTNNKQV